MDIAMWKFLVLGRAFDVLALDRDGLNAIEDAEKYPNPLAVALLDQPLMRPPRAFGDADEITGSVFDGGGERLALSKLTRQGAAL